MTTKAVKNNERKKKKKNLAAKNLGVGTTKQNNKKLNTKNYAPAVFNQEKL